MHAGLLCLLPRCARLCGAGVLALSAALAALALPAWASPHCDAPPQTWQPRSAVVTLAERQGWRVDRLKIDDGCYELHGHDADGRRIKVKLDPATLKVISLKRGQGDHDRDGAPPSAPASGPGGHPPAGVVPPR